jgi:RuvB-like protein 2
MRCDEEDVTVSDEGLEKLVEYATRVSLRYAMQLITVSALVAARRNKDDEVNEDDIRLARDLFLDQARSEEYLARMKHNLYIGTPEEEENGEEEEEEKE